MKPIIFREEARLDALDAYEWYERQCRGLGQEFRDELDATLVRLAQSAGVYAILWRDTRRIRLRRFPYSVFYRDFGEAIVVVGVFHFRRDPQSWRFRS